MKPKLIPDLDKYLKKDLYQKPITRYYETICSTICNTIYNNLYFCFFVTFFITFLSYRYVMKTKRKSSNFDSTKVRREIIDL